MNDRVRWVFGFCVALSLTMIAVALHRWGAAEVRTHVSEILLLTGGGAVWLILATKLFPWLGLSVHDDAVERRNVAALVALSGAILAVAIIYAGGSLGEGPSYLNNLFSATLGTTGWLVLWVLLELGSNVSKSIAEERDLASGLRLCAFLVAVALVLGRAVAGDWHSETATLHDFVRDGWPAAPLCGIALIIERFARPSRRRPFPAWSSYGLLPALLYLSLATNWLCHIGLWEGKP